MVIASDQGSGEPGQARSPTCGACLNGSPGTPPADTNEYRYHPISKHHQHHPTRARQTPIRSQTTRIAGTEVAAHRPSRTQGQVGPSRPGQDVSLVGDSCQAATVRLM